MERPLKILIVDDSEDDAFLLVRHLQTSGLRLTHEQVETRDALEAAASNQSWDVVLCDYSVPGLSPVEALNTIRQHDQHVPLIVVSGAVGEAELVQLVKLGAQDIVLKDNLARLKPVIERELAETQVRRDKIAAEARLISAIESITEGIALFDAQDRLTLCNRRYREILDKCSPLIMPQTRFEDLLRYAASHGQFEDIGDDVEEYIEKRLALRRNREGPFESKFCGDRWIRIEDRATCDGGVVTVLTDITERKKLDLMKDEFVSVVGHELRTPLTSVKGSLALLESGTIGALPDQVSRMISIAHKNSNRLIRLINDILDLQKIKFGQMSFKFNKVAVRLLLEEAVSTNQSYANEFGVYLIIQPIQEDIMVMANRDRLMQVLTNLLSNAIKFSSSDSAVTLGAKRNGNVVRISVADQGIGVAENFRNRIFQKFSQADASDTRKEGGSGLGLSITKAIVEHHGGRIGFDSVEGKGATFYFDLPVWRSEPSRNAECGTPQGPVSCLSGDFLQ